MGLQIQNWLCVAPIWVLPQYFSLLAENGARRVVVLSSTSRYTKMEKAGPSDKKENSLALGLADAEERLKSWAGIAGVERVVLRPTLIYGLGQDKNVSEIARFIRRFGFFPLLGRAAGLRQPIHVQDVAGACIAALGEPAATNLAYNITGGETLPYREMVGRIFDALHRPRRFVTIPLTTFKVAVALLRVIPRYQHWSAAMAERMNHDQVFESSNATRDLGFSPRRFRLALKDLPQ